MDTKALLPQLSLDEKIDFVVGGPVRHTALVPRLNIPNILMTNGPHGINKYDVKDTDSGISILFPQRMLRMLLI